MVPTGSGGRTSASFVFKDGLGERRQMAGAGQEPFEVLRFTQELSANPAFEASVRERFSQLAAFRHESFARVRAVERLDRLGSSLVLVSDHVRGVRLSQLLAAAEKQGTPVEFTAVAGLIRQLVGAMCALHESAPDAAHGALGPERLVVTADGRLVVLEYVMGTALEQLRCSQERYWKEWRIALPRAVGMHRFDAVTDVAQVGAVALALVVGRPIGADEYPNRLGEVVGAATATTASGTSAPLPLGFREWLLRTLRLDPRASFRTMSEVRAALELTLGAADGAAEQKALKAWLVRMEEREALAEKTEPRAGGPVWSAVPAPVPEAPPSYTEIPADPAPRAWTASAADADPVPVAVPAAPVPVPPAAPVRTYVAPEPAAAIDEPAEPEHEDAETPMPTPAAWSRQWTIAAAIVLIAATTGATLFGRRYLSPAETTPKTGTLVIGTNPDGVAVLVDGQSRGKTPLTLALTPGAHGIELVTETEHRKTTVTIVAGGQVQQFLELPRTAPALGDLNVRTEPARARVTVDGRAYGRSPVVVQGLTAGTHTVVLENDATAITQEVTIEGGATASLVVPMAKPQNNAYASGWIAVSAPVDVQVFEDGRLVGSSRSDRIMVAVGRHDFEIVNEALGYRVTKSVDVGAGQVAPVRLDWPKGTVAVNALPWAEVWIDGERIGETPIGSVSLPLGVHEVVFRHPELGERRATTTVTAGATGKLSVDLRRK